MQIDVLSIVIGLVLGLAVASFVWAVINRKLDRENLMLKAQTKETEALRAEMGGVFSTTAQDVLRQSNEQFLQLAKERLSAAQSEQANDFEKRQKAIAELVDPINKNLKDMEQRIENLGKTGTGLEAQLKTFISDQRLLREETRNLVEALRNPAARGKWGEMQLQRAFEMIGMVEGTHYRQQQSIEIEGTRRQPDFILSLPGKVEIIIDVKTPVEPYWKALDDAQDDHARNRALDVFRKNVRDHLKSLSSKEYWRHFESPEFVVMFLPTEGLYSMAVSNDPSLIEEAARHNVILASPTTLMGLLRIVMHGWQQQSMAEEAKKVATLGTDLYTRIATFAEHMQKVGKNLGTALNAYNQAVGSLERSVLPGARKFKELHVQTGGKEIPVLSEMDHTPRTINVTDDLPEADQQDNGNPEREHA